ncbi:acyl-CoA dehydrogenase family protein [Rhodococcus rhodochrous]|uniref:acyl-CoA dehydrogenase family protein n=1 Tax=Rhodococcus rhodochrous TaxID=1829 RepID=UPI0027E0A429|nr:acyl-CoA dehydrogenase family protein [Rhodococcus rhodochrous]
MPGFDAMPEEQQLRASVSAMTRELGPSYFQRVSTTGEHATEQHRKLTAAGFLGVHLPEEYGGGGAGLTEFSWAIEETARAGVPALSAIFSAGVNGTILARHGTAEQKDHWLRGLATGDLLSSFAITESDAGTNSHNIRTEAHRDGTDWIINGQKYYTSGMDQADFVIVVARTGHDHTTGRGRLSMFIPDADAPGLSQQNIPTALQIPERQATVFFDNVRVPADRLVGEEGRGLHASFAGLNAERLLVSSICLGVGRYALTKATTYATNRTVWTPPIGATRPSPTLSPRPTSNSNWQT